MCSSTATPPQCAASRRVSVRFSREIDAPSRWSPTNVQRRFCSLEVVSDLQSELVLLLLRQVPLTVRMRAPDHLGQPSGGGPPALARVVQRRAKEDRVVLAPHGVGEIGKLAVVARLNARKPVRRDLEDRPVENSNAASPGLACGRLSQVADGDRVGRPAVRRPFPDRHVLVRE